MWHKAIWKGHPTKFLRGVLVVLMVKASSNSSRGNYVHFRANTLEKDMNPLNLPAMG